MDGWADYEGKVTRHEDLFPEDNTSPEEEAGFSLKIDLTNKKSMESKGKISFRFNTRRGLDRGITQGTSEGVKRQEVLFGGFKITEHHTKR
jgi:hypothetical protein